VFHIPKDRLGGQSNQEARGSHARYLMDEQLQRALNTLRAIRRRYEMERHLRPEAGSRTVHAAFGDSDMSWIAAVIEALRTAASERLKLKNPP
jgi:hypothetical protein